MIVRNNFTPTSKKAVSHRTYVHLIWCTIFLHNDPVKPTLVNNRIRDRREPIWLSMVVLSALQAPEKPSMTDSLDQEIKVDMIFS